MAETTKKRTYTKRTTAPKKTETEVKETSAPVAAADEAPIADTPVAPAPINMVVEQKAPPVKILYIDSVIPNNQIPIGNNRYITGSGRIFSVPMEQFEGEFMSPLVMKLIDNRKFIVIDGLTDEQREQYNCFYKEGEVIRNEGIFDALFDMNTDKAASIYTALCPEHKHLVATRFITAYFERHDNRITRDTVEKLNAISKSVDAEGLFTPIVKDINDKV